MVIVLISTLYLDKSPCILHHILLGFLNFYMTFLAFCDLTFCLVFSTFTWHSLHFATSHFAWFFNFHTTSLVFCITFCLVFQLSHNIACFLHHISLGFSTFTSHPLHFASHFAWFFNFHVWHFTTFDINNKISGWHIKGGFKVKWRMISCHQFHCNWCWLKKEKEKSSPKKKKKKEFPPVQFI